MFFFLTKIMLSDIVRSAPAHEMLSDGGSYEICFLLSTGKNYRTEAMQCGLKNTTGYGIPVK